MPEYLVRFASGRSVRVSAESPEDAKQKARYAFGSPRKNEGVHSVEETAASRMERKARAREDAMNRATGG